MALAQFKLEKETSEANLRSSGWLLRSWSPGGDTILGGDPRKAVDKRQRGREMRDGAVGRESVEIGRRVEKRKAVEGEEDQRSGKEGEPGCRGEKARLGTEWGRRSEKRQMVEELEAEGSCGPLGRVTGEKGDCMISKSRKNVGEVDVFGKDDVQGGKVTGCTEGKALEMATKGGGKWIPEKDKTETFWEKNQRIC